MTSSEKKPNLISRTSPFIIVLLGGFLLFFLMLVFVPEPTKVDEHTLPWKSVINEEGNIEALGLETNVTSVIEAKWMFRDDINIKLFAKDNKSNKFAEAFLPSLYVGGLHSAIVLRINVSEEKIAEIYNRGVKIRMNESGIFEITPTQADDLFLKNQTFSSIVLVPRKNLTPEIIKHRFGEPEKIIVDDTGLSHWFFPEKGLKILHSEKGREALIYQIPLDTDINITVPLPLIPEVVSR